ncbi:MAG: 30S ribosomal protein S20 [Chloroflexota bacterium]
MANTKSALKMIRVSERRRLRNKAVRSAVKTFISRANRQMAISSTAEDTMEAVKRAIIALDKAAEKGIIHKNNAARRKSRLMQRLNKLSAQA